MNRTPIMAAEASVGSASNFAAPMYTGLGREVGVDSPPDGVAEAVRVAFDPAASRK